MEAAFATLLAADLNGPNSPAIILAAVAGAIILLAVMVAVVNASEAVTAMVARPTIPVAGAITGRPCIPVYVGPSVELARQVGVYRGTLPSVSPAIFDTASGQVRASIDDRNGTRTLRFTSCPEAAILHDAAQHLAANPLDLATSATVTPGRCRICGCTMEHACPSVCWWADESETLCRQHGT